MPTTLHQELSPSGVQVQVVLPGATHTGIWARAGVEASSLPASILMEVDEMVDAALVGLDRHELVTMPRCRTSLIGRRIPPPACTLVQTSRGITPRIVTKLWTALGRATLRNRRLP